MWSLEDWSGPNGEREARRGRQKWKNQAESRTRIGGWGQDGKMADAEGNEEPRRKAAGVERCKPEGKKRKRGLGKAEGDTRI